MLAAAPEQSVTRQRAAIEDDAVRFGVAVPVILAARYEWSAESVRKIADELVGERLLDRFKCPGDGRAAYYALAPGAAARLGVKAPPTGGYSTQGLIHRLYVLLYAARSGYAKITSTEFRRYFDRLTWPGANLSHYVADFAAEAPRLGWVIVDDHHRDPRRFVTIVGREYGRRFARGEWREHWLLPGRFFMSILTDFEANRLLIEAAVREKRPRFASVEVVALEAALKCLPFNLLGV
jgi:hypothetical protein